MQQKAVASHSRLLFTFETYAPKAGAALAAILIARVAVVGSPSMPGPEPTLPLRETSKTSWLSHYRFVWRGSTWEPFLAPSKGGFAVSRIAPQCIASCEQLPELPGVYELALVKSSQNQRYKVYIGQTSSLKRRFNSDYRGVTGSHLRPFFDEALKNGCQIWRRFRIMATPGKAFALEAKLLRRYDYAWNTRQAGCQPRHIDIVTRRSCFTKKTTLVSCPALPVKAMKGLSIKASTAGPLGSSLPAC